MQGKVFFSVCRLSETFLYATPQKVIAKLRATPPAQWHFDTAVRFIQSLLVDKNNPDYYQFQPAQESWLAGCEFWLDILPQGRDEFYHGELDFRLKLTEEEQQNGIDWTIPYRAVSIVQAQLHEILQGKRQLSEYPKLKHMFEFNETLG